MNGPYDPLETGRARCAIRGVRRGLNRAYLSVEVVTMAARRKSPGPMHSKAQWKFLMSKFGDHGFVHRWAHAVEARGGKKTGYRALPARTGVRKRV